MKKKLFCILLSLMMVITMMPVMTGVALAGELTDYVDVEYENTGATGEVVVEPETLLNHEGNLTLPDEIPGKTSDTKIVGVEAVGNVVVVVNGDVCNDYFESGVTYTSETGVTASGEANVTVTGFVKNGTDGNGVTADGDAVVTVTGCVDGAEIGVSATDNAKVTVSGENASDAIHGLEEYGVYIEGGARVEAKGNILSEGVDAIHIKSADGARVEADGNATGVDFAIHLEGDVVASTVIISGDAIVSDGTGAVAIESTDTKNTVIVEGKAVGDLYAFGGEIYVGELDGEIDEGSETNIFYLVGLNEDSVALTDLLVSGSLIDNKTEQDIEGLKNKKYWSTVNASSVSGMEFSIKSASGQELKIDESKLPDGVTMTTNNGVITLTAGENFKGGLQDLLVTINDVVVPTSTSDSSYPVSTYTPAVSASVTGDADTVKVIAIVSGETAMIDQISDEDIAKVTGAKASTGLVEIDLSGLDKEISAVFIPVNTVEKIAEAANGSGKSTAGMSVKLSNATVTFDAKATNEIAAQAGGSKIKLVLDDVKTVSLNAVQKEAVEKLDSAIILDAYLLSGGRKLCTESLNGFNGGKATVSLPYEIKGNRKASNYKVFYVDEKGNLTNMNAKYDAKTKSFIFDIEHFSNYVLAYDENA